VLKFKPSTTKAIRWKHVNIYIYLLIKVQRADAVAQWWNACLACARPWVAFLALKKKKN
jgi:hypothetical protein